MITRKNVVGKWTVLASVGVGSFVSGLDGSIANTVLPLIARDFKIDVNTAEWVLIAYLLVVSSLSLTLGRLGDVVGHRRLFLAGFSLFTFASIFCGSAPNEIILITFRSVQAIGGASMTATSLVLVTRGFGSQERGRAVGLLISITYIGLVTGPAIGGLVAGALSWRAVFYINLPIGLTGIFLGFRVLPLDAAPKPNTRFDLLGAGLSVLSLTAMLLGVSQGSSWGWLNGRTLASFAIAAIAAGALIQTELLHSQPMLDVRLFRNRPFSLATSSTLLNYVGVFFTNLLLPFYLVEARQFPVNQAGLLMMATPIVMMVLAPQAGRLSDRFGPGPFTVGGMGLLAAGLFAISALNLESTIPQILGAEVLVGLGTGLFSSPNASSIMGLVPANRQGTASGIVSVMRGVGQLLGIALAGTIFALELERLGGPSHFVGAFHAAFVVGAGVALLGCVLNVVAASARIVTGKARAET